MNAILSEILNVIVKIFYIRTKIVYIIYVLVYLGFEVFCLKINIPPRAYTIKIL